MRITQSLLRDAWLRALNDTQSQLLRTQDQVSTGKKFSRPAEDPVGAVQVLNLQRALSESGQYSRNADLLTNRLGVEETALTSVGDVMQRLRELAVEANNATQSGETRGDIASEVRQALDNLVQLANTRDGGDNYLFAGYSTQTQPFSRSGSAVTYAGDQGQRQLQIGANRKVADSDSGAAVFQAIPNGNGVFTVQSGAANTGSGVLGQRTLTDPSQYDGGSYAINFTSTTTYEVRDSASALVASGVYAPDQLSVQSIVFRGIQFEITGAPAAGDSFQLAASRNQDLFATVQNFITALESGGTSAAAQASIHNQIGNFLADIDRSITHVIDVRAEIGSRLNAVEAQKSVNADVDLHGKSLLSDLQDVDYAEALSRLNQQLTGLQASEKAFALTQRLSLFNYL